MVYSETICVAGEHPRCITFRIDRERDESEVRLGRKLILKPRHFIGHRRADCGASCEDEVRDPNFTLQICKSKRIAMLISQSEVWHLVMNSES